MLKNAVDQKASEDDLDEEGIVNRIYEAIIEQRLPPGTKLSEAALCEAFGVGRMRVRRSLLLLASRGVVDLQNNRGAYVAQPTMSQALEVFEARRTIEPNVARLAARRANKADVSDLAAHLDMEAEARRQGNRQLAIRLSGQFHVRLAKVARNEVMERMVKELVTRTSLIIGMYGSAGTKNCHDDEHGDILEALRNMNSEAAASLMEQHLRHIEQEVDLTSERKRQVNLVEILSGEAS
ncbi:GntR family transcriptional regulator [Zhengella mangrovi]|uniref:GntR family transcriptional regulator n=1 Tax=Zhengella mangrovi TaxID=1982044 RepID=A0A2G1QIN3_9HYPH|nr:GntR family transcriptional regulator [Zhengella mangrovi]PHP65372.1 GntR family transcriptional regulator [Zhengella mangrovi]